MTNPGKSPDFVYRNLAPNFDLDPLPPVYDGPVYHYTHAASAALIAESGVMHALDVSVMNDPSERLFGWEIIRQSILDLRSEFSPRAERELTSLTSSDLESLNVLPIAYVVCGSELPDSLNQYRLYGDIQLELANPGAWLQQAREGWQWIADHASWDNDYLQRFGFVGAWRRVQYGIEDCRRAAESMVRATARMIEAIDPSEYADETLIAAHMLEVASLYMKHQAYAEEKEVRLVFQDGFTTQASPKIRSRGRGLTTYVETAPLFSPLVKAACLGPLAGGEASARAMQKLISEQMPMLADPSGVPDWQNQPTVTASTVPYRDFS
ncbi:hypothetical protein ACFQ8E_02860 [Isoptericola sp. NPDC056573]|uniref:hypothetical protein n=1 Tax=Isoptericola sp. NPDC056573 TaxID=3345868 RepID=UPI00368F0C09